MSKHTQTYTQRIFGEKVSLVSKSRCSHGKNLMFIHYICYREFPSAIASRAFVYPSCSFHVKEHFPQKFWYRAEDIAGGIVDFRGKGNFSLYRIAVCDKVILERSSNAEQHLTVSRREEKFATLKSNCEICSVTARLKNRYKLRSKSFAWARARVRVFVP